MWFLTIVFVLLLVLVIFRLLRAMSLNGKSTEELIIKANGLLGNFYGLILSSPQNLSGKLDNEFATTIMKVCTSRLNSLEYRRVYQFVVAKYGSVEKHVYDWLGGALATMYTVKQDLTQKEKYTLDFMLNVVNTELKKLGAETFFTKDAPMGTRVYPDTGDL